MEIREKSFRMYVLQEIKKIIDNAYEQAKRILRENRDKLDQVAAVLIEREKITGEEFDGIFEQQ